MPHTYSYFPRAKIMSIPPPISLADPGGATGARPQRDPILAFWNTFSPEKWPHRRSALPPPECSASPPTGNPGSATADVRFGDRVRQLISIYCLGCIVGLVVLLIYYLGCVDRSGSLSGGAFNQLRLATLNIVLTILY